MNKTSNTNVEHEREFATHLAYRILNDAASALLLGKKGHITIPLLEPQFSAICGRSLQLLADKLKVSASSRFEELNKCPSARNTEAVNKEINK